MSFLITFLYIIVGFFISKVYKNSSTLFSFLLVNFFIPIVVFLTIVSYKDSIINVVFVSYLFSILMYLISLKIYKSRIEQVCFSYFNIGWLGLPVAIYIFGSEVAPIIIAAYIGGMFFGSTFVIWLFQSATNKVSSLKKLLTAPPFISFIFALLFKEFYGVIELNGGLLIFYKISKFVMSFLGMALLGIWIQRHPIKKEDIKNIVKFSLVRFVIGLGVLILIIFALNTLNFIDFQRVKYLLIIPFLPVAANVVVLESYYLKSAKSSSIIAVNTMVSILFLIAFGAVYNLRASQKTLYIHNITRFSQDKALICRTSYSSSKMSNTVLAQSWMVK